MGRRGSTIAITGAALALALAVVAGSASAAAIDIAYTCSPAPVDCSGWYRSDVTITWSVNPRPEEGTVIVSGCSPQTITADTTGTLTWCEAQNGTDQARRTKTLTVDKTPPAVTGAVPQRAADDNGWYRLPVTVDFHGTDATSGLAGCTSPTYSGPDGVAASVLGTCTDVAGNVSAPMPFAIQYDATAPTITKASPERKPDRGGWYTRPVEETFTATDNLSGLDQCPPALVAPSLASAAAPFAGTCTDRAGNVASRVFTLPYDATPPSVPVVTPHPGDGAVRLVVHAAADTAVLRISRTPGLHGARRSTLYEGRPAGLTDSRVGNGRRYRYVVTAIDEARNAARRHLAVTPGPRLLGPSGGATVAAPPRLEWTRVRHARYYNVQLFRGGRKVLSSWPTRAALQLRATWRFGGHGVRLTPGRYRWYVWPGFGPRRERRFGALVGSRHFLVQG
jgi:hypothetical protein